MLQQQHACLWCVVCVLVRVYMLCARVTVPVTRTAHIYPPIYTSRLRLQHEVILQNNRDFHHLAAMLCSMEHLDPKAYADVPDHFKTGLMNRQQFNEIRAGRTQEQRQARLDQLAATNMLFRPYSDTEFAAAKAQTQAEVGAIIAADRMIYIGTSKHDGVPLDDEIARWARVDLVIERRDGKKIKTRGDLESLGFVVVILHTSTFMFNIRCLETYLHGTFQHDNRCLWQNIGASSYSLSDEAIQVWNPLTTPPSTTFSLSCVTVCYRTNWTTQESANFLRYTRR